MSSKAPVRLPNLKKLKVKSSVVQERGGPCMVVMTNLLNCWASNAHGSKECAGLEQDLKTCMTAKRSATKHKVTTNYHAARLLKKINPKAHD
ncbi:small ribosomal subunit protein mS37 [Trichomonascus vanleenenianus]|uniref:mitochondrial 37S ribosomal protein mS37 MRP10 n=1 Tax=Trichomonascus vanleenenianus TaxID=2268995 RepID=UPI003EC967A5